MDGVLLLISGASGAGKTSVREAIAADLAPTIEAVELRHLDAIPACPDVAWRQRMAERAVVRARALEGKAGICCWPAIRSHRVKCWRHRRRPPSTSRSACST